MSRLQLKAPATLQIWQQNARKSQQAHEHILNAADPTLWDIIAIQEPWIDKYSNSRGNFYFRTIYPSSRKPGSETPFRSLILINTNISTDAYNQIDINSNDITAIQLISERETTKIFNLYIDCNNNDTIETLNDHLLLDDDLYQAQRPRTSTAMIWLGDFNRHHAMWDEPRNSHLFRNHASVEPLLELIDRYDMKMALPERIPTLEASATGNWTRPDNVWYSHDEGNPFTICNVNPSLRPPITDHLPIVSVIELSITRLKETERHNFRETDWEAFQDALKPKLDDLPPPQRICNVEQFNTVTSNVIKAIQLTIVETVPISKPNLFRKRWWMAELTDIKKKKNRASREAFHFRDIPDHPAKAEHKRLSTVYAELIKKTKDKHWNEWLKYISASDLYKADKYVTDYAKARIPTLTSINQDGSTTQHSTNESKCEALMKSFFPQPPSEEKRHQVATAYPKLLSSLRFFSRKQIKRKILSLSPYKAPGPDGILNVVLMRCADQLIDHLFFIYRAIFELEMFYDPWLNSVTVVLRKPGKPNYALPKAYRPVGLLDSIEKLFAALVADDLSYLSKKHNLLPPSQFGGRRARTTTDSIHLVTYKIKQAWRQKKVAAALFLDVQGAFPNTVKEVLIHNMKSRQVPTKYVMLAEKVLTNRTTIVRFDDFSSQPIPLDNGTTQGCCLSMILYAFYNAPLMEIAEGPNELSAGFVDDVMFLATANSLREAHGILKDMMERNSGGFDWSTSHNSPFELSKLALMNFPRCRQDETDSVLILEKHEQELNERVMRQTVPLVETYKYLGVLFDPKLRWKAHSHKVISTAAIWTQHFHRLGKIATGIDPIKLRRLYLTVAVPRITYAADIWYTPGTFSPGKRRHSGIASTINKLKTIQRRAMSTIIGGMRTTARDTLEAHANVFPPHLLLDKACMHAANQLATLNRSHPLHKPVRVVTRTQRTRHPSPLHNLFWNLAIQPNQLETIEPVRRRSNYDPPFVTSIAPSTEAAINEARNAAQNHKIRIYSDGSCQNKGVGAAAALYVGNKLRRTVTYYLGSENEHTVYEAEGIGLILGLHLLTNLTRKLTNVLCGLDNQAVIQALDNQFSKPSHHILDQIHKMATNLQTKEDRKINAEERKQAKRNGKTWTPRVRDVFDMTIKWILGHEGIAENELVDSEAKRAAGGTSSPAKKLPAFLRRKPLPQSKSALKQSQVAKLKASWKAEWKKSTRQSVIQFYNGTLPSPSYLTLTSELERNQISLLTQLRTEHIPLNQHLHHIAVSPSSNCPNCDRPEEETTTHFLFLCPCYAHERAYLKRSLGQNAYLKSQLYGNKKAIPALLKYVDKTQRLLSTFGVVEVAE